MSEKKVIFKEIDRSDLISTCDPGEYHLVVNEGDIIDGDRVLEDHTRPIGIRFLKIGPPTPEPETTSCICTLCGGPGDFVCADCAAKEPELKFKVGDGVIVKRTGEKGTVSDIDPDEPMPYQVDFGSGDINWYSEDRLRAAPKPKVNEWEDMVETMPWGMKYDNPKREEEAGLEFLRALKRYINARCKCGKGD